MIRAFIISVVLISAILVLFCLNITQAETIELIEEGRIVAGATAIWKENDPKEIKDRLFKLTMLINFSLNGLSNYYFTKDERESLKNRIRIMISDTVSRDAYALWLVKTDKGKELRITGNSIDHTERAVTLFLEKYLKLDYNTMKDLELLINKKTKLKEALAPIDIDKISFKKVKNLIFEQKDIEIRIPLQINNQIIK